MLSQIRKLKASDNHSGIRDLHKDVSHLYEKYVWPTQDGELIRWFMYPIRDEIMTGELKKLYVAKNRRGVSEMLTRWRDDIYYVFKNCVSPTQDRKFIRWYLTSSNHMMLEVMKGIHTNNDYPMLYDFCKWGWNLKTYLDLVHDNITMVDIIEGKTHQHRWVSSQGNRWITLVEKMIDL